MALSKKTPTALAKQRCWKLFSRYIREKYADRYGICECFTCGVQKPIEEMDCGHGISGRGNFVLFLEEICRPQCKRCNVFLGGVYERFIPQLIELYGQDAYEEWYYQSKQVHKRTLKDYEELEEYLKDRLESIKLETV